MTATTTTTDTGYGLDDYLSDVPRSGRTVRLYLDGAGKPGNFDRYVMVRDLGQWGLLDRGNPSRFGDRAVFVDAADLDELLDEAIAAHGDLVDAQGGPRMSGPQVSLVAIVRQIGDALTATQGV